MYTILHWLEGKGWHGLGEERDGDESIVAMDTGRRSTFGGSGAPTMGLDLGALHWPLARRVVEGAGT